MAYNDNEKHEILKLLIKNDFQVKNAVSDYNEKNNTKLERGTVYDWLNNDEKFKKEVNDYKFELLDEAEKMHQLLRRGIPIKDETGQIIAWQEKPDRAAIEFFLKCKGKERGYFEKTEIEHSGEIKTKTEIKVLTQDDAEKIKNIVADLNNE